MATEAFPTGPSRSTKEEKICALGEYAVDLEAELEELKKIGLLSPKLGFYYSQRWHREVV
ncbi:MAG: hypothetical protein ACE5HY_05940, partial [Candidatus Hydrothermarchaeales archaeon]